MCRATYALMAAYLLGMGQVANANNKLAGPFAPSAGLAAYQSDTGWGAVYHNPNQSQTGQCVWFCRAVRPDSLPSTSPDSYAHSMWDNGVNAGWHRGGTPKVGAVACFGECSNYPYGHVAIVTAVNGDGSINVWESNVYASLEVDKRHIDNFVGLQGYLYAANSDTPTIGPPTCNDPPLINWSGLSPNRWYGPADLTSQVAFALQGQCGGVGGLSQSWDTPITDGYPAFQTSYSGYLVFQYLVDAGQQLEGQHTAYVRGWNSDRTRYTDSSLGWFGYDASPPSVSWTQQPTTGVWYNTDQMIAWHVQDDLSGVYGWDQGWAGDPGYRPGQPADGYLMLSSVPGAGWWWANVHTCDNVGNNKWYATGPFGYDVTAPVVSLAPDSAPAQTWQNDSARVRFNVTDPGYPDTGAGVRGTEFAVDNDPWDWTTNGDGQEYGWSPPEGKHTLKLRPYDRATSGGTTSGNGGEEHVLGEFWFDRTAPTVDPPTFDPPSPGNPSAVHINCSATDPLSGVKEIRVSVDGSPLPPIEFPGDTATYTNTTNASGSVTWDASSATEGDHTISVTATDVVGNPSNPVTGTYHVAPKTKANVFFSFYDTTGAQGQTVTLKTLVYSGGSQAIGLTVQFSVDGTVVGSGVSDASGASCLYAIPASVLVGLHTVTAYFAGDATHNSSTRSESALTVTAPKANVNFSLYPAKGVHGDAVSLKTLVYVGGKAASGVAVKFAVDGGAVGSAISDASGASLAYTIPDSLSVGVHNVTVSCAENSSYSSASRTTAALSVLGKVSLSIYAAKGAPGDTVTLRTLVYSGGTPVSGLPVVFAVNGTPVGTATSTPDGASLSYRIPSNMASGTADVTVSFGGNAGYGATSRTTAALTITVAKATVLFSQYLSTGAAGQTVTLKTLVYTGGAPVSGLTITFAVDGTPAGSATSDATGASRSYTIPTGMAAGPHNVTVSFAGDATHNAATRTTAALTVK